MAKNKASKKDNVQFQELSITSWKDQKGVDISNGCLLYTSPSPRDRTRSRMPSSA